MCGFLVLCVARTTAAGQATTESRPPAYRLEAIDAPTLAKRYAADQVGVLEKLNRRDTEHLIRLETIVVPEVWAEELALRGLTPLSVAT